MTERAPWTDGIDRNRERLWTYSGGPSHFDRVSHRNDAMWAQVVEARKLLIEKALAWRDAAICDGWNSRPTYDHEPENKAFTLSRDGYKVLGLARPETKYTVGSGQITCWGPDNLQISVGETYDWGAIQAGMTICAYCHKTDVKTERVGFAGRCCAECLPAMRAAIERPGWTS